MPEGDCKKLGNRAGSGKTYQPDFLSKTQVIKGGEIRSRLCSKNRKFSIP
jgi:hypothetical protein